MNQSDWETRLRNRWPILPPQKKLKEMAVERDLKVAGGESLDDLISTFCDYLRPLEVEAANKWAYGGDQRRSEAEGIARVVIGSLFWGKSEPTTPLRRCRTIVGYCYMAVRHEVAEAMLTRVVGPKPKTRLKMKKKGETEPGIVMQSTLEAAVKVTEDESRADALSNLHFARGRNRPRWRKILRIVEDDIRDLPLLLDEACVTPREWLTMIAVAAETGTDALERAAERLECPVTEIQSCLLAIERRIKSVYANRRLTSGLLKGRRGYGRGPRRFEQRKQEFSTLRDRVSCNVPSSIDSEIERVLDALGLAI